VRGPGRLREAVGAARAMDARRLTRRSFLGCGLAVVGATVLPARAARAAVADLDFASAFEAARAIRRGDVSSVELTTRMLDRIARFNPKINAIVTLAGDAALARARAADEARARGEWWGPFHGVPCTVKDTFEVAGVYGHKPTLGVVPLRGHIPPPPGTPPGPPPLLPVAGPLARSAADLRAALEALGGPDEEEARAYRWSLAPARGTRLADYRIGF